jgi:SAM-dependent methyltransferase
LSVIPEMSHTFAPSDELRDVYERRAELQYAAVPTPPDPRLDRKFERVCSLLLDQLPARSYLDAGCGDGRYLAALASWPDRPERVAATDISERILETARAAAGFPVETARGNLEALPFQDASFDLVLCTQVIEHLLDPERGLRELARVLRPGGRAVVTTDNRRARVSQTLNLPRTAVVAALGLRRRREVVSFPHRDFTVGEVRGLCAQAGLEVEHLETFRFSLRHPLDWPPAVRALNALERRLPRTGVGDIVAVIVRRPD